MQEGNCVVILKTGQHSGSSYACGGPSAGSCRECGSDLCQLHAEECDVCHLILCGSCYDQHVGKAHSKTVQSARGPLKIRRLA
jgi:predicted sulfurtransferase